MVAWALTTNPTETFVPGKNNEILKAREEAQAKRLPWDTYDKSEFVTVIKPSEFSATISSGLWLVKLHIGSGFDQGMRNDQPKSSISS